MDTWPTTLLTFVLYWDESLPDSMLYCVSTLVLTGWLCERGLARKRPWATVWYFLCCCIALYLFLTLCIALNPPLLRLLGGGAIAGAWPAVCSIYLGIRLSSQEVKSLLRDHSWLPGPTVVCLSLLLAYGYFGFCLLVASR